MPQLVALTKLLILVLKHQNSLTQIGSFNKFVLILVINHPPELVSLSFVLIPGN
jgi:hypothetical protein